MLTSLQSELLIFLAQACITLLGFVSIFFIFRYKSIDTYIDNRQSILRSILRKNIETQPEIEIHILTIGRNQTQDLKYFSELGQKVDTAIYFVKDICKLSSWRIDLKRRAMFTLIFLTLLTMLVLFARIILNQIKFHESVMNVCIISLVCLFVVALGVTLNLLYRSFGQRFFHIKRK